MIVNRASVAHIQSTGENPYRIFGPLVLLVNLYINILLHTYIILYTRCTRGINRVGVQLWRVRERESLGTWDII